MEIKGPFNNGLLGVQRGIQGLDANAAEIASQSGQPLQSREGRGYAQPLVESRLNLLQVKAGVAVIETADEMLGSLFDDKA